MEKLLRLGLIAFFVSIISLCMIGCIPSGGLDSDDDFDDDEDSLYSIEYNTNQLYYSELLQNNNLFTIDITCFKFIRI